MLQSLWRLFGGRVTNNAIKSQTRKGGLLDAGLGFALLKSKRVSWKTKLLALLMGAGVIGLLVLLELPVETIVAGFLPVLGVIADGIVDGLEFITGPVMLAVLLMPHLTPKPLVQQIRAERTGIPFVPPMPALPTLPAPTTTVASQREITPPMSLMR